MAYKLGYIGYFGWGNFGDELFVKTHNQRFNDEIKGRVLHDLLKAPYFSSNRSSIIRETDVFLIGGGDLLNPIRVSSLYWNMEYLEKPVAVAGISVVDPGFQRKDVINFYQSFFSHENVFHISVRDAESKNWFDNNIKTSTPVEISADLVTAYDLPFVITQSKKNVIGVILRNHRQTKGSLDNLRSSLNALRNLGYKIKFVSAGIGQVGKADYELAHEFARADEELFFSENLNDICLEVAQCDFVFSMKLHGLVVSAMYSIPALSLLDARKHRQFQADLYDGIHTINYMEARTEDFLNFIEDTNFKKEKIESMSKSSRELYRSIERKMKEVLKWNI